MDREEVKQYIRTRGNEYLQKDKSGKGFVCPVCGSGTGSKGTGITTKDGIHFTCWAGCFTNSDIIDIIGIKEGIPESDYNSKLKRAAEEFNIVIDSGYSSGEKERKNLSQEYQKGDKNERKADPEAEPDYTDFFLKANKNIEKTDYHRGISLETLNHFKIGYVDNWTHPKAPQSPPSPRLIIPTSRSSYLARDTRASLTPKQEEYSKSKVGKIKVFNSKALTEAKKPIILVEGELDCVSVVDVGGESVALGSINYVSNFLKVLENQKPAQPIILALDNESDPEKRKKVESAEKKLIAGMEKLSVTYYKLDITGECKDANEALNKNREALKAAVEQAENIEAEALEAEREKLKKEAVAYSLQSFIKDIEESKRASFFSTGFKGLDDILDGGLYAGLYIVGAVSSLGKTTLCLQISDCVARQGEDVLLFSLEMSRNELIAKSVSRLTLIKDLEKNGSTKNAKTTRGILTGSRYKNYSRKERELIQEAITSYGEYGENIYITEGIGDVGAEAIREKVADHVKITGKAPLVLIDYIQILAPADPRMTDKQCTDKNVLELKRLSRDFNIPVMGISSFNRDNYLSPVNLASFKESGAVEYGSDCLMALQFEGMDYQEGEKDGERQKRIRKLMKEAEKNGKSGKAQNIQIKVLKNRNGSKGDTVLDFYPMFNYFEEKKRG